MRWLLVLVLVAAGLGCASDQKVTADECRGYLTVARAAIVQCARLDDPVDAETCRVGAQAALDIATAQCGRLDDASAT